jgi:uncharacterized membrane protein
MRLTLLVHIVAGTLGLAAGFLALYTAKGGALHRKSGTVFVYAMLTMCIGGFAVAVGRNVAPSINIPAALLTAYLVVTSLITVRPPAASPRGLHVGLMLIALTVGLVDLTFAFRAVTGDGTYLGMPAFPYFLFGGVGALGAVLDVRMIRAGGLRGASRLARHLWRMCFALFIAALSFFIGQADIFPEAIRIMPVLALPVLAVLVTMFYWLWRVRVRRSVRGLAVRGTADVRSDATYPVAAR